MTLSSTLRPANGRTSWNVRPMPRRQTASAARPSMRRPAKVIVPPSGTKTPAIMLKSVVLPAPFGPMTPQISPAATSNVTASTAVRPRNRLVTASSGQQRGHRSALRQAEPPRQPGPDAAGQGDDDEQQAGAVEHLLGAGQIEAERGQRAVQRFGKAGEQEGADDRPEQRSEAADDRADDDLDRARDVEDLLGKQVVVVEGVEDAGEGRHAGGNHHRQHLVAGRC